MEVRKYVTKASVLEKVNQFDIFKAYIGNFQELGKKFRSELRQDKNPTCLINRYGDTLLYRDFAVNDKLDCFAYIMKKCAVTFQQSLEMINLDFKLRLMPKTRIIYSPKIVTTTNFDISKIEKAPVEIEVQLRDWTLHDKHFWNKKYGITISELRYFGVYPLQGFWIRGKYYKAGNLSYGYYFGILPDGRQSWKIYQPYDKQFKWIGNCPETTYQGYGQLPWFGDNLIITKSLKDVIVLHKLEWSAIAPQGETVNITDEFMNLLRERFKNIVLLYDNDKAGIEATIKIAEQHNIPYFFMPDGVKDASDFVEDYGIVELGTFIKQQWLENKHIIK